MQLKTASRNETQNLQLFSKSKTLKQEGIPKQFILLVTKFQGR